MMEFEYQKLDSFFYLFFEQLDEQPNTFDLHNSEIIKVASKK